MTTIRFDTTKEARNFARFARRAEYDARQSGNEVTVDARPHDVAHMVRRWGLRRGALPTYHIVDYS